VKGDIGIRLTLSKWASLTDSFKEVVLEVTRRSCRTLGGERKEGHSLVQKAKCLGKSPQRVKEHESE